MKRLRLILLRALPAASALFCVASIAAWIMGPWSFQWGTIAGPSISAYFLSSRGSIAFQRQSIAAVPPNTFSTQANGVVAVYHSGSYNFTMPVIPAGFADIGILRYGSTTQIATSYGAALSPHIEIWEVRYWFLVLLTAILPANAWFMRYRKDQRIRTGRCTSCGYDLRATHGRCPECGTGQPKETNSN